MRRLALSGLFLALLAVPLHAADGLYLTWGDCPLTGAGQTVEAFGCDTDTGFHTLICGLTVGGPIDSVLGIGVVVDLQPSAPKLPAWWGLGGSDCRASGLRGDTNFGGLNTCVNFCRPRSRVGCLPTPKG